MIPNPWKAARRLVPLALAVLALAPLAATAETILQRGLLGTIQSLDPHKASGTWENMVLGDLFEGLLTENAAGEPIPGQAERWEISGDRRVYTFYLREDARWSDGSPVTADDFEFAFKRLLDPATKAPYAAFLFSISGARDFNRGTIQNSDRVGVIALDAHTLLIILNHPTPQFLAQLTHWSAFPLPKAVVERRKDTWIQADALIGNGPFRLVAQSPGRFELVRNEHYYGQAAVQVDRVIYQTVEDKNEGLKRFRAGELHIYPGFPAPLYAWLRGHLSAETRVAPFLGVYYYTINLARPPFGDVRIRRALALSIDRELIVEKVRGIGELPAYTFVPPGVLHYTPAHTTVQLDFSDWPRERRLAEARTLLAAAGYGPGKPLSVTVRINADETHQQIADTITSLWREALGVHATVETSPVAEHYAALQRRDYTLARVGWIADYNDAQNFLFLGESASTRLNYAGYSNAEFDLLMDKAAKAEDWTSRAKTLQGAETLLLRDLPYIPIFFYMSQNLVAASVQGYQDNVQDIHRTRWLRLVNK